ncbi:DUF2264 domain-containing protein [Pseudescherichia vulneris]
MSLSKQDYCQLALRWIEDAAHDFSPGCSRIKMGETSAQYPAEIAQMEGFSRLLWGIFPLISGGVQTPLWDTFLTGIRNGCNPLHDEYWGDLNDNDQRCVEMAVYGLGLILPGSPLWAALSATEREDLSAWLRQSATVSVPDNNWHFFPVLIQAGLKCVGQDYDMLVIDRHLDAIEPYYLGNGWYSDGAGKPRDYYISSAFHFYSLLYSHVMKDVDPERCVRYRQRARQFAQDYIHYFTAEGAAIPFGRSLTYRFIQAAFWSAVAYTGLDVFTPGIVKGLVLRHLDWWVKQPFSGRDGLFSIGYTYPNLIMAEDYNSPGSPYWGLKTLLILALEEESPFWQAECEPLPELQAVHCIAQAGQIIVHDEQQKHAWMVMSGQFDKNDFVNFGPKYSKFAYSSHFGFCLERGSHGLNHVACDSMLMLSAQDGYFRGRRECDAVAVSDEYIYCEWSPWPNVKVMTWLVPSPQGHVRIHKVSTYRVLNCAEGGFSVNQHLLTKMKNDVHSLALHTQNGNSRVDDLLNCRQSQPVITPPNSNVLFSSPAVIPCLFGTLEPGSHWLACWVSATINGVMEKPRNIHFDVNHQRLYLSGREIDVK